MSDGVDRGAARWSGGAGQEVWEGGVPPWEINMLTFVATSAYTSPNVEKASRAMSALLPSAAANVAAPKAQMRARPARCLRAARRPSCLRPRSCIWG